VLAIVLASAALSFQQEYRAGRAIEKILRASRRPRACCATASPLLLPPTTSCPATCSSCPPAA